MVWAPVPHPAPIPSAGNGASAHLSSMVSTRHILTWKKQGNPSPRAEAAGQELHLCPGHTESSSKAHVQEGGTGVAGVAQSAEQAGLDLEVVSSSPTLGIEIT